MTAEISTETMTDTDTHDGHGSQGRACEQPPQRRSRPNVGMYRNRPGKPTRPLTSPPRSVEALARELDALRRGGLGIPRHRATPHTSARSSTSSASSSSAAAPCCSFSLFPPGLAGRHRRPVASPRSSRTWRSATTSCTASGTGCATRRSTRPPGSGTTPRPAEQWKHSHNELHHTYTNVIGKDNDLGYGIMRVDEDQRWHPDATSASRCGTSSTPASSSTASRPTTSSSASNLKAVATRTPSSAARPGKVLRKIRQADAQGLPRPPAAVRARRFFAHHGRQRHRQPGPQPLDALGHHVRPLPRGRRDLREAPPSTARPAASGTCARCSARPTSPATRLHAHHDRQPVAIQIEHHLFPDLPRQPVRRNRAEGPGDLQPIRPVVHIRIASPPGGLSLKQVIKLSLPNDFSIRNTAKWVLRDPRIRSERLAQRGPWDGIGIGELRMGKQRYRAVWNTLLDGGPGRVTRGAVLDGAEDPLDAAARRRMTAVGCRSSAIAAIRSTTWWVKPCS